jgi:hypothetical protein
VAVHNSSGLWSCSPTRQLSLRNEIFGLEPGALQPLAKALELQVADVRLQEQQLRREDLCTTAQTRIS